MPPPADGGGFWTNAAFMAAALTAAAGFISLVAGKIYEQAMRRSDFWEGRRASIVRFRVDVELRREGLLSKREAFDDPAYVERIKDMIRQHAAAGKPLRLYGVEVSDTKVQDEISGYLATFPEASQKNIRQTILKDRQMTALYTMMTTKAFETLDPERQIAAFESWLDSVRDLIGSLDAVKADQPNWAPDPNAWVRKLARRSREG